MPQKAGNAFRPDSGDRQRNARNIPASRTIKKATLYNSARKHSNTARKTLKVSQ